MTPKDTPKPLPVIPYDDDPLLAGLRIGNAIWRTVYGTPPLSEREVPEPLRISRTLKAIKGGRS